MTITQELKEAIKRMWWRFNHPEHVLLENSYTYALFRILEESR